MQPSGHHPFREFSPVPDATLVMGCLSPRRTRSLHRHGCSHRMGLSRHVIPVSSVVPILTFLIAYHIDHITSGSANFKTALSLLSSFFVPEDDDALLSWIEQMLGDKSCDRRSHSGVRAGCNSLHQVGMAMRCYSVASVLSRIIFLVLPLF
jgi:hypothetical protein